MKWKSASMCTSLYRETVKIVMFIRNKQLDEIVQLDLKDELFKTWMTKF